VVYKEITGSVFKEMMIGAVSLLENNKQALNDLNVFPVPDGDTGTNMSMTMMSAIAEVNASDDSTVTAVVDAIALGALKGARGNSGVILSQILRGFARGFKGDVTTVTKQHLIIAFEKGSEAAYKAVMKPKEGTILTIARALSEAANVYEQEEIDIYDMLVKVVDAGEVMLQKTPDMLPVLKEAGVVDAGGEGLLVMFRGMIAVLNGDEIDSIEIDMGEVKADFAAEAHMSGNIEFAYCTEFFVVNLLATVSKKDIDAFRDELTNIGDCVLAIGDMGMVKVHVHTNHPGKALELAGELGDLSKIKIDNMREQHTELEKEAQQQQEKQKPIALVAVASGSGMADIFRDFMVDSIIEGGQTMNPSAKTIADAIEKAPSDNVIVFPNNKNIIMAAEQASQLSEKQVFVVPSQTLPQGISSVLAYNPEMDVDYNVKRMTDALNHVKTGQVTYAVRDATTNGHKIEEGEIMGISDGEIVCHEKDINDTAMKLIDSMISEDDGVITVFYGEGISEKDAQAVADMIEEKYDDFDVELHNGGQPVYSYIFSVE
jgi:uncharacterized protein